MKLWVFLSLSLFHLAAFSETLRVAAASDLRGPLPAVVAEFEKQHSGAKVEVIYGASGAFFEQISHGSPIDVFLSADADFPQRLLDAKKAIGPAFHYASGELVMWSRTQDHLELKNLSSLKSPKIIKIAIANPAVAPYGKAAKEALQKAGLWDQLQSRIVVADSVSQSLMFAQTGAAQVSLTARNLTEASDVKAAGSSVGLSKEAAPSFAQKGVIVASSKLQSLAMQFREAVMKPGTFRK